MRKHSASSLRESILLRLIFPVADRLMGTCAMKWYKQISEMENWSSNEVKLWQEARLQETLQYAYEHTKYYREVFDSLGIKVGDIKSFEDLKKLPVLTKDIVKSRYADLVPDDIGAIRHRTCFTGGSTGHPMKYLSDENTWGFVTAMKIFSWQKFGYHYGDKFVSLGSSSLFPVNKKNLVSELYFRLRNTIPLNGMNMDDAHCREYMDIIRRKNVRYIYGYSTAIFLLAKYCLNNSIDWQMKVAFPTAEKLTDYYRNTIEQAWGAKVMDCYGCRDGGITAYEVESSVYHVGYASYFETLGNSQDGPSILCVTNLLDKSFPFIRYINGDEVIMCDDGEGKYNGQCLKAVVGRTSDVVEFANGHKLTTSGFNSLFRGFNIEAFRIRKQGEMSVLVQIQKRLEFSGNEEKLLYDTMKKYVGEDCEVKFEYVKGFEPLPNGKRSFLLNS